MKYNSEHYLIAQMYQAQERQDVNTDKDIKEFVESFKSRFGSFIIEPGSFKLGYSDESNPCYMDVASVNLSTTDGNIKSGVVIFDRFAIGTSKNKVFANFIDENTKLYFEEAFFGESITIVKQSNQEDAGIYCCYASRDKFNNDYSLNICYIFVK